VIRAAAIFLLFMCVAARASRPATLPIATLPSTTEPAARGPDVVMLGELAALYDPVPFDHRSHARMSGMWDNCQTCHHQQPGLNIQTIPIVPASLRSLLGAARCKTCHAATAEVESADLRMPGLKAAYHRQCLNCHRDWMGENACVICHAPRNGLASMQPTPDDIVGRMHPPIAAPSEKRYRTRFTPVAGANVLFRHEEHVKRFGLQCSQCHHRDTCADCHSTGATKASVASPIHFGRTWRDTHGPCAACHSADSCGHCHYRDDQKPPPPFDHALAGQSMDKDHASLECRQCHERYKGPPSCGDASCHKNRAVQFPADRPGPVPVLAALAPGGPTSKPIAVATSRPTTAPASTRPTVMRIRRGGL